MASGFLWKPSSDGGLNPGGLSVLLQGIRGGVNSADIFDESGNKIDSLTRSPHTELGTKFYSRRPGASYGQNLTVKVSYSDGRVEEYQIPNGAGRFEGPLGDVNPGPSNKGMGGGGGGANPFAPNQVGEFGFAPFYLGGQFPSPELINYEDIESAPYNFTDALEFAREYGAFNREELRKANELGKDFALDALGTELEGLQGFVPASSALKRQETSLDNQFNQAERERQVSGALPYAREQFADQRKRAQAFAEGRIPDEVADRALELGVRSSAADRASAAGFGARSSASRSAQDLMSAQERVRLSQYGDEALTRGLANEANLFLAPTQYSDAGAQVRVMPSLSGSQLQTAARQEIANFSGIPATTALASNVQQEQFRTTLEQNTRQFNATNDLQAQQFNANTLNNFALTKFQYDVGYAGAVAGAAQTNLNTQVGLQQQAQFQEIFKDYLNKAQTAGTIGALGQLLGGILGILNALGFGESASSKTKNPATGTGGPPPIAPETDSSGQSGGSGSGGEIPIDDSDFPSEGGSSTPDQGASSADGEEDIPIGIEFEPGGPAVEGAPEGEGGNFPDEPVEGTTEVGDDGSVSTFSLRSATTPTQKAFEKDTGMQFRSAQQAKSAEQGARAVEQASGVYTQPVEGTVKVGYGRDGQPVYSAKAVARSSDTGLGAQYVDTLQAVLNPFGVFGDEDRSNLQKIRDAATDASFAAQLTDYAQRGDSKRFVEALVGKYGSKVVGELAGDKAGQGTSLAYSAYKLFDRWGNLSPAQRAMGIASLGIKGYKFATGENLTDKYLVAPKYSPDGTKLEQPGLNVGQAISLFQAGYNVYALVDNWDEANTLQKIAGATGTVASIANVAQQFGLLNTASSGASAGAGGAAAGSAGAGGAAGGGSAAGSSAASTLGAAAGAASIALGAKQVYDSWGQGGKEGAAGGAAGGAAVAAGYYGVASAGYVAWNPYIAAAVVAVSIAGGAVKTGKHKDQTGRDAMRNFYYKNGLMDKNHKVLLADGTEADIGIDGGGDRHEVTNPSLLVGEGKKRGGGKTLNAYDIDYTNDLDYASGMGGITLSRLLAGGIAKNVDQMGGQLGNAALKNVGFGKELTRENFDKVMANQRGFFSKAGIKSKQDAWELVEQGFSEGRWNELDRISMHQTLNMMYDDDGYSLAQNLMAGRNRGLEVAAEDPREEPDKLPGEIKPGDKKTPQPLERPTFQGQPVNDQGFRPQLTPEQEARIPSSAPTYTGPTSMPGYTGQNIGRRLLTREEMAARNAARYAEVA